MDRGPLGGVGWFSHFSGIERPFPFRGNTSSIAICRVSQLVCSWIVTVLSAGLQLDFNRPVSWGLDCNRPVSWRLGFNRPVSWRLSFNRPVGWRLDFNLPVSWKLGFNRPVSWRLGFNRPVSCIGSPLGRSHPLGGNTSHVYRVICRVRWLVSSWIVTDLSAGSWILTVLPAGSWILTVLPAV